MLFLKIGYTNADADELVECGTLFFRDKPIYEVINGTSLAAYTGLTTQGIIHAWGCHWGRNVGNKKWMSRGIKVRCYGYHSEPCDN